MMVYFKPNHIRLLVLAAAFSIAIFFATYQLIESPSFWYDEGWYFQSAANVASEGVYGIQFAPGDIAHVSMLQTVSYPLIFPLAAAFRTFGTSVLVGRSLMVAFILTLLATAYWLSRRLHGPSMGVAALALLATFAPLYGNGKSILGEVPGLVYLVLFLLCLNLASKSGAARRWWLMAAGISAGLALATKPFFFIAIPAIAVGAFIAWRRKAFTIGEIGIVATACLVPMAAWCLVQFQSGESLAQIAGYYASPYSFENPTYEPSLLKRMWDSTRALFYSLSTIYTVFILSVWTASLVIRKRVRQVIPIEEAIGFVFSVSVFLAYLRIGIIFRYFFPAQVVALIFLPAALGVVVMWTTGLLAKYPSVKRALRPVPILIVSALCALGVYQLAFDSWVAEAYGSHKTEYWQGYFADIASSAQVFFYDTPEIVPFARNRNYYQLLLSDRQKPLGREYLSAIASGTPDKIFVETSVYEPMKDDIFAGYEVEEKLFKYSVLVRKGGS